MQTLEKPLSHHIKASVIPVAGIMCLTPYISSAVALILGIVIAVALGNPYIARTRKLTSTLLSLSVMGLGAGMDLGVVGKVGLAGVGYTVVGISTTLVLGYLIGKLLRTERDTSILISVGTAICGGSAIAAVAPTIRAKHHEISIALGTVFLLNALALFIFPPIGHILNLSETQFGLWSALAIHDTSSVVGSTLQYGPHALEVGTTVKLARALWIVPVTFLFSYLFARGQKSQGAEKPKRPWFILGFLIAAALVTWIPEIRPAGHMVNEVAKKVLVLTLFLIGTNLTKETIRSVGLKPLIQGISLWIVVASATLGAILIGWIH
ncbi:YeiH family protein [Bdellovibrio svalbardensis]|uniref:Sulfate exporter family transporter n=1 Tax=Bdellovibrio svalbardensis TaxID=2972972 RepID=A0ABT6DGX6_9BACT|nr:putative sulfate exporter family transporter [Bdellovibrio svalbardensis]MDG0815754.1 putative sulfate exporter family transporter [Bdellovibrio svalbardensis]